MAFARNEITSSASLPAEAKEGEESAESPVCTSEDSDSSADESFDDTDSASDSETEHNPKQASKRIDANTLFGKTAKMPSKLPSYDEAVREKARLKAVAEEQVRLQKAQQDTSIDHGDNFCLSFNPMF